MAESSVITCSECKKKFKAKGDLAGKRIRCPFCSETFIVPGVNKAEAIKAAAKPAKAAPAKTAPIQPEAPAKPARIFAEDEDDKNPYSVSDLDIAPRCPNCANLMADEKAHICLFCGYNTLTREWGETKKVVAHTAGEIWLHLTPGLVALAVLLTFMIFMIWLGTAANYQLRGSWAEFMLGEWFRMWLCMIVLGTFIWAPGVYAFNRLIGNPTPEEKEKGK